jgi:formylglycine-generating enzyme required for sulfatase activity
MGYNFFECAEMVLIPSGTFMMGGKKEPDQSPVHEVFLDHLYIDTYEVTQEDFESIVKYNLSKHKGPSIPVEFVDWFQAMSIAKK